MSERRTEDCTNTTRKKFFAKLKETTEIEMTCSSQKQKVKVGETVT
jgi:hypothetical protein